MLQRYVGIYIPTRFGRGHYSRVEMLSMGFPPDFVQWPISRIDPAASAVVGGGGKADLLFERKGVNSVLCTLLAFLKIENSLFS